VSTVAIGGEIIFGALILERVSVPDLLDALDFAPARGKAVHLSFQTG
jgi:hypothetical protein